MSRRRHNKNIVQVKPIVNELEDRIKSFSFRLLFKKHWKVFVILTLLVCIAYANSLHSDFVSDDIRSILKNDEINKIGFIFDRRGISLHSTFCFIINKLVGKTPIFYRLVNICFHLGAVLLTYILFTILIDSKVAFFIASILAVHPIQIESVTWISGAGYVEHGFFVLFVILAYMLSKKNKKLFFISIIGFIFSIFSSHLALVLPIILLLFVISFGDIRRDWKSLIPFFVIITVVALIQLKGVSQRVTTFQADYYHDTNLLNPLLQIPIAITSYLELIFWPVDLTLYHSEMSFSQTEYIFRLIVFIIFLGIIVYGFRRSRRVFFGLSFFIVSLSLTLTPFGITWIVAERYAYIAVIGIFMVIALGIKKLSEVKKLKIIVNILFSLIIISLLTRTIIRNIDWKNEDNLWIATGKTSPSSPNTHNNLGDVYGRQGDIDRAIYEFEKAIEIKPNYADAYHNLANTYQGIGRLEDAIENYEKAIHFNPKLWQSYQNLGAIYFQKGRNDLAKEYFRNALEINPYDYNLHTNFGLICLMSGDRQTAKEEFQKALQLNPNDQRAKEGLLSSDLP